MTHPDPPRADSDGARDAWVRMRALVDEALARSTEGRRAYLDDVCGDDPARRERIERLIAACERADENWGFLAHPAGKLAAPLLSTLADPVGLRARQLATLTAALADRYRLDGQLGAGGMSRVYRADDLRHHRQVAIKVLDPEVSAALGTERFRSEIRTTAALQHPHIVPLFDSGTADGQLFFVMPLVEGETLRARIKRETQLPVSDAVRIAVEVASALDYAHRRGVVHRDIKPANILMHEGRALVADFGIARAMHSPDVARITKPGTSLGTPQYMSPEQARGEQDITAQSDIYSLGAVTYEMFTGQPPFTGVTAQQIVTRVCTESPRAIGVQRQHVPPIVEGAVLTALAKRPTDRFESAGAFARALGDTAMRGAVPARASRTPSARPRLLIVSLSAMVFALAAFSAWTLWSGRDAPADVVRLTVHVPRELSMVTTAATSNIAVSPDGRVVLFAARADGGAHRLYARALDDVAPRAIAGTEGAADPFFAPDGRSIAFWSARGLQTVPIDGGTPTTLTTMAWMGGGTWTTRGVIVFPGIDGLYVIPSAGGTPTLLVAPDATSGESAMLYPLALADGEHVLYSRRGSVGQSLGMVSLSRRSATSLGIQGTAALGVVDGHLIYASHDDTLRAVAFRATSGRATGVAIPVATGVGVGVLGAATARLSLSGTLAYRSGGHGLRMAVPSDEVAGQMGVPDAHADSSPRVSPDGRRIAGGIDAGEAAQLIVVHRWGDEVRARLRARR